MPRMRDAIRSGWNGSSASVFSPTPRNLIGLPVIARTDNAAPPRASPSDFREHDAGQRQRVVERLRGVGRILTGHRIDDEQRLDRIQRRVQRADLGHHVRIDREPARRVDDQHVGEFGARFA